MKQVDPLAILGNPKAVNRQRACPSCSARTVVFADGSLICVLENKCFAPEPGDGELWQMRQNFDKANGIDPASRLIVPARLAAGLKAADADERLR